MISKQLGYYRTYHNIGIFMLEIFLTFFFLNMRLLKNMPNINVLCKQNIF